MRIFEYKADGESADQVLSRTLKYACRLFLSERGAVFRVGARGARSDFVLLTGYNFTEFDVIGDDFAPARNLIEKVICCLQW